MVEKRFEAVCELGKAPYLVDYSAKYVKSNGVELTIKRTFEGDYDVESSDSDCIYFANLLNALHEENMEYYQIINCKNCKYHNWDWFDDGEEFEVCDKGNTERLIYHQFCKEWEKK